MGCGIDLGHSAIPRRTGVTRLAHLLSLDSRIVRPPPGTETTQSTPQRSPVGLRNCPVFPRGALARALGLAAVERTAAEVDSAAAEHGPTSPTSITHVTFIAGSTLARSFFRRFDRSSVEVTSAQPDIAGSKGQKAPAEYCD